MQFVWILTTEVNEMNQFGEYFVAAFDSKPSVELISKMTGISMQQAEYVLNKGSNAQYTGYRWFNLKQVELMKGAATDDGILVIVGQQNISNFLLTLSGSA